MPFCRSLSLQRGEIMRMVKMMKRGSSNSALRDALNAARNRLPFTLQPVHGTCKTS